VVYITSPTVNWDCNTYALNDSNSDGIWTGNFILPNGSFDYIYCTDGWTDSESNGLITAMQNGASCAPITDYSTYANRAINITSDTSISNVWGSCSLCIGGCTSPTATNYNSNADYDDGSCNYNTNFNVTFQVDMNNVAVPFTQPEVNGTFNSWCGSCATLTDVNNDNIWDITLSIPAGYHEYKFSSDNWTAQEDLLNAGNCVVSAWGYTNRFLNITSDTILDLVCWGSCAECISSSVYGCTDPTATNYDPLVTIDNGTCIYAYCTNPSPSGAYVSELIHDRVRVNWDNMNDANCMVTQYRIKYRELGSSTWSQKNMANTGLCQFGLNTTSKIILGLFPSTNYEYYMKAWYCGGGVSTWSTIQNFTTLGDCPNVGNLTVTSPTTTKATFTWDASNGAYSFVRLQARVDTVGSSFFNIGGVGVNYGSFTKNKNGLVPGESYRAKSRTWCDPNGGAYKAPSWTSFIYWTQPTSIRLEGGSAINNLTIYPNPSRDVFNVSFTSDTKQNLKVRILNVMGEELINENLEQFIGEYTKQINLIENAKGIYFLEIETNDGIINKKLILQ
jgi:hypothetical protein